ncbi:MAG: hypothetical protein CMM16_05235 [Rhodospirillaceae bacterium]|nr:hypothetical protein [Rhodospirillaceae bacterium]
MNSIALRCIQIKNLMRYTPVLILLFLGVFFSAITPLEASSGNKIGDKPLIKELLDVIQDVKTQNISDEYPCFSSPVQKRCTERPQTKNARQIKVQKTLRLLDILEVNQIKGTWTIRAFMMTRWKDRKRLRFKGKDFDGRTRLIYNDVLADEQIKRIWTPNLTIINAISERNREKLTLTIDRNGTVQVKEIFTAEIRTNFDYRKFPFDEQTATIEIEPFTEINKSVRLVPAVRKSGNSSTPPDTWEAGEFSGVFSTRPGARFELSSDKPGAWLAPDGANDFSLVTYKLELKRNYLNFLTTAILILFLHAIALWFSAMSWDHYKQSIDWPFPILISIVLFSQFGQTVLPTLSYLTLYDILRVQIYIYFIADLLVWTAGRRLAKLEDIPAQIRNKRIRVHILGPLFIIFWALTIYLSDTVTSVF